MMFGSLPAAHRKAHTHRGGSDYFFRETSTFILLLCCCFFSIIPTNPRAPAIIQGHTRRDIFQLLQGGKSVHLSLRFADHSLEIGFPSKVTGNFAKVIHGLNANQLTDQVIQRSKRMILDTLGVGLLGTRTEVCHKVAQYSKIYSSDLSSTIWGHLDFRLPPLYAAFVNGVAVRDALLFALKSYKLMPFLLYREQNVPKIIAYSEACYKTFLDYSPNVIQLPSSELKVHSMDFDDTWHPATHPSGAVLPALIALSEAFPQKRKISGLDLLLAFNVGIEVQGRLLHFSREARNIPRRFHPPAVVGTMGSAAACAKLLALDQLECKNALAIAASYAGAPLANAATQIKPLHVGNAAKNGLEAACLAFQGLQGNKQILDMESGMGAFYTDYNPQTLPTLHSYPWLLDQQDVAIKRFPAHLATHWVADAACSVRRKLMESSESLLTLDKIEKVILKVPEVKYVNRPSPASEHEARHSFQFVACSALLDGSMSVQSFTSENIHRPALRELLCKTQLEHPPDNTPSFDSLYCQVSVTLRDGSTISDRCTTFYGHWRQPLEKEDLEKKFQSNTLDILPTEAMEGIIETVYNLEKVEDCSVLSTFLAGQSARALPEKLHFL